MGVFEGFDWLFCFGSVHVAAVAVDFTTVLCLWCMLGCVWCLLGYTVGRVLPTPELFVIVFWICLCG